jgi:hypothetical protein
VTVDKGGGKGLRRLGDRLVKALSIILVSGGSAIAIDRPAMAQVQFSDLENHWARECISQLADRQIVSGYWDGEFKPRSPMNRGEFAAILTQAFPDRPFSREEIFFVDLSDKDWAYPAIRDAYRKGFLSGFPGLVFKAYDNITRLQVLIALTSGLQLEKQGDTTTILNAAFADAQAIPEYARDAIASATENNIVVSDAVVRFLRPNEAATRGEVAGFFCQAIAQRDDIASPIPSEYIAKSPQFETRTEMMEIGAVKVDLSYQKRPQGLASNFRIALTRAGELLQEQPLPVITATSKLLNIAIADLNGDGEDEIILDLTTEDARCCYYSIIYRYQPIRERYAPIQQYWGTLGYQREDLNGDGVVEFQTRDRAIAEFFPNLELINYPLQIFEYRSDGAVLVTSQFPEAIAEDARRLWQLATELNVDDPQLQGILASYLAEQYLLGTSTQGWEKVEAFYPSGDRAQFFDQVEQFLQQTGYLKD